MLLLLILIIIAAALGYVIIKSKKATVPSGSSAGNEPPAKLLDLNTTTVAERQRAYNHGFRQQLQFDELQRRAEAAGDTATLEAIRLGTYDGPLPPLKEDTPILAMSQQNGNPDAPIQNLEHFCIKDKGYHVSVWPKDQSQFDIIEFNIAGISHRDNIDDYLGEFVGTLEPEPTNAYDPNAIKILAPDGHHVGYVPADMTSEVRSVAALPCPCYCYIGCNTTTYFSDCYIFRNN
jgi:hypothetical protein